ncbi:LacI family DNA-binding transcriptional regulator [Tropicimonas isoalkanivorans]|uniref:Transcriptional regulator, LacI family n=1 Tax=Tropicimonas isoalkanivorans TaxID=441112 RepID=A0A1I1HJP6_9RHOB|nr:LacI family DNA-binding transcriptional regulator [Tropicimonas isoalkanivorans]SFC24287.1 transcriptional regulator, LacI family [Tropicimonas isoalkanivorans]
MNKEERKPGIGKVSGRKRVTMQDVARVAGCSQSTVSFVLSGNTSANISEPTRLRVLDAVRDLGYRPMQAAGARRTQDATSGTIALVIDKITTSPEGIVMLDGVREIARSADAIVLVTETDNDPSLEPRTVELFVEMGVRAIVYACIFTREVEIPNALRETSVPVVLLNCYARGEDLPAIIPGEVAGGHRATNALLQAGHRRIGTITGEIFMEAARDRLQGYRNALATADLPFDPALVVEGDWSPSAGYRGTRALLSLDAPPTAIFCQNDRMAIGCYEALKEMGKRIPDDISVIGYDDAEIALHMSPPLTSLILPSRAMGRWAAEHALAASSRDEADMRLVKLECELVERESIGPPPATTG